MYWQHALLTWIHVIGAALWVGPQVFLATGWPGAARQIADTATKVEVIRVLTQRFAYLGGFGLLLLAGAGTYLIWTWRDYYAQPGEVGFWELRYGVVFTVKMASLAVMLAVTALHMFVVGPRQLDAMAAEGRGEPGAAARLARARRHSRALSGTGLLLALAIMGMGAALSTASWSMQEW